MLVVTKTTKNTTESEQKFNNEPRKLCGRDKKKKKTQTNAIRYGNITENVRS